MPSHWRSKGSNGRRDELCVSFFFCLPLADLPRGERGELIAPLLLSHLRLRSHEVNDATLFVAAGACRCMVPDFHFLRNSSSFSDACIKLELQQLEKDNPRFSMQWQGQ